MTVTIAPNPQLDTLVSGVRSTISTHNHERLTARLAADKLRQHLRGPDILTAAQRRGDPARHRADKLHVEPDGSFSVLALLWRPRQVTRIHDHISWCVCGVIQGVEHKELFDQAPPANRRE
jgi:3-mercaptopropionate dioxygenase